MKWNSLKFAALLLMAIGCRGTNQQGSTSLEATPGAPGVPPGNFVGCAPSVGECQHSCPENNGMGVPNDRACTQNPISGFVGCYCPMEETPTVDRSRYEFIGCHNNGADCVRLCYQRPYVAVPRDQACADQGITNWGCYCGR